MKKLLLIILIFISVNSYGQDEYVTNLNLTGRTVKILSTYIYGNNDTAVSNAFYKLREDYIDGNVPNDNANVQISILKTTVVASMYEIMFNLPSWVIKQSDVVNDFQTSISSKRATNELLDSLCTGIEDKYTAGYTELLNNGLKLLSSK